MKRTHFIIIFLLVGMISVTGFAAAYVTDDVKLYLPLNVTFDDFSESARTPTLVPTNPTINEITKVFGDGSGYFPGNGYVTYLDSDDFNFGTGDFSIAGWVYFKSLTTSGVWRPFYAQYTDATHCIIVGPTTTSNLQLTIINGGSTLNYQVTPSPVLNLTSWNYLVLTRSGNVFTWYINGVEYTNTTSAIAVPDMTGAVQVGYSTRVTSYFTGYIDDFRVYKGTAINGSIIPPCEFFVDGLPPVASFVLTLTDTTIGFVSSWQWNATNLLGDNIPVTISTDQNPILTLTQGNWLIDLIATNDLGSDTCNSTIGINLTSPQVYFWSRTS